MEVVVASEGQLVRCPAVFGKHVKVAELVGRARGGRIDEALSIVRDVGTGPVEALLLEDGLGPGHARSLGRHAPDVSRSQGDAPVGKKEQLFPVRGPGGLNVHVPFPEVEAVLTVGVVPGEGGGRSVPASLPEGTHVDVEVPAGLGGDVGQTGCRRGKRRDRRRGGSRRSGRGTVPFSGPGSEAEWCVPRGRRCRRSTFRQGTSRGRSDSARRRSVRRLPGWPGRSARWSPEALRRSDCRPEPRREPRAWPEGAGGR